jgi:hypothetical protein
MSELTATPVASSAMRDELNGLPDQLLQFLAQASKSNAADQSEASFLLLECYHASFDVTQSQAEGVLITPTPGFVIKTTVTDVGTPSVTGGRTKPSSTPPALPACAIINSTVCLNICSSEHVAAFTKTKRLASTSGPSAEAEEEEGINIPLAVGPAKEEKGQKTGRSATVFDVVVNPGVIKEAEDDTSGAFRHFLAELALQYVERKTGLRLSHSYRIPRGTYKGTAVSQQRIRSTARPHIQEITSTSDAGAAKPATASSMSLIVEAGGIAAPLVSANAKSVGSVSAPTPAASNGTARITNSGTPSSSRKHVPKHPAPAMDIRVLSPPETDKSSLQLDLERSTEPNGNEEPASKLLISRPGGSLSGKERDATGSASAGSEATPGRALPAIASSPDLMATETKRLAPLPSVTCWLQVAPHDRSAPTDGISLSLCTVSTSSRHSLCSAAPSRVHMRVDKPATAEHASIQQLLISVSSPSLTPQMVGVTVALKHGRQAVVVTIPGDCILGKATIDNCHLL